MFDIIIVNVPGSVTKTPLAAPALLKSSIEKAGFTCQTIDFNIRFYIDVKRSDELENYFSTGINTEMENSASQLMLTYAKEIISNNPKYVGISVFTYQNQIATRLLCYHLRNLSPVKIVVGGQGLSDGGIQGAQGYAKQLYNDGLIDYWIKSEGEISIVELLRGNTNYPGINSDTFSQIDDIDSLPFPNYDDYDLSLYNAPNFLPITASRGCVRACSFCDIHEHWKYRYRSGKNVSEEIIHLNKKYNINKFKFTDSLINGSLKEFNQLIKILAEYNKSTSNKISWSSQFIVRQSKQINDDYWKNISESGGENLAIGVETGSDRVREHMNKKFTNHDLDYTMYQLNKYKITCTFLMIVGYPTETEKDFQDTLDMFTRYKQYANSIIIDVNLGSTLSILPGTPLHHRAKELNIELDNFENNWVALDNSELTLEKRLERIKILKNHLVDLGYNPSNNANEHMLQILENNLEKFNKRLKLKKMIKIKNRHSNNRYDN